MAVSRALGAFSMRTLIPPGARSEHSILNYGRTAPVMQVLNPATDALLKVLPCDEKDTIHEKMRLTEQAQPRWYRVPTAEKKQIFASFRDLLRANQNELAATLTSEMGKPISQAKAEIGATCGRIDFFLDHIDAAVDCERVSGGGSAERNRMDEYISYEPLGVVANISAWNYPYFVGSNVFVPALLTGNAVLYKPSEHASLTGIAIAELLYQAGVPRDVFMPVVGPGKVGAHLVAEAGLGGVFFTGSYSTGKKISEATAGRMIRTQLELGGKDAVYISHDLDGEALVNAAHSVADGAMYNAGQSCCSVERVYVHAHVYEAFVEAFTAAVRKMQVGDAMEASTYMGPLAMKTTLDRLEHQIEDAVGKGGQLVVGTGKRRPGPGNWFDPCLVLNANNSMSLMREESFGPVIGVANVKSEEDAVALMRDTEYGLTASVYSTNGATAVRVLEQMPVGTVYWNCCDRVSPALPWSGRRHSGMGVTLSKEGIRTMMQPKAWHMRHPA